jgi:hypothetical protein
MMPCDWLFWSRCSLFFCFASANASAAQIVGIGGKCLNVQGGGSADGTPIILWPCSGTPNEQ